MKSGYSLLRLTTMNDIPIQSDLGFPKVGVPAPLACGDKKPLGQSLKIPFGVRNGRLVAPRDTLAGKACGCSCPSCDGLLVSNQGKKKRPYFSHLRSTECSGSYESAVHLMAKQVIAEAKYVGIPPQRKVFSRRLPDGHVVQEPLLEDADRIEFVSVLLEKTVEGLRPDIAAMSADGTLVFIEIFVTHAVTDDKRDRLGHLNVLEIDLSHLSRDAIADVSLFSQEVLTQASRAWIARQYSSEQARKPILALNDKVRAYIATLRTEADVEKATLLQEAQQAEKARQNKTDFERWSDKMLERYAPQLEQLRAMVSGSGAVRREQRLKIEAIEPLQAVLITFDEGNLPDYVNVEQVGDWIFEVHRSVWQAYIFEAYVLQSESGTLLKTHSIIRDVLKRFGQLAWARELAVMKSQWKKKGRDRGEWYAGMGACFLSKSENEMIPNGYLLVLNYLRALVKAGFLEIACERPAAFRGEFGAKARGDK
jgi:hypothetical protein